MAINKILFAKGISEPDLYLLGAILLYSNTVRLTVSLVSSDHFSIVQRNVNVIRRDKDVFYISGESSSFLHNVDRRRKVEDPLN